MMKSSTRRLVTMGVLAGPLFTLSWIIAGATRGNGYSQLRHPISSLSIGSMGWTQIVTFLVTGTLLLGFSISLAKIARVKGLSAWGAYILVLCAIGLIGAGIFISDPLSGYPDGLHTLRENRSIHGILHDLFSAFLFLGFPFAAYRYFRYFSQLKESRWAIYTLVSGIAFVGFFVLTSMGFGQAQGFVEYGGLLQRITITIFWCWTTLLAVHTLRGETSK